ncbi:helix-turn-helix transcriptional regulator [Phenylobacterium sp.]|jgi:AraC-like DNA-binding protein|uniref:helix-turn-helix transcriptional regulator n=1 Tax=Phenylobacterium sp. TaxID=1871053 RepID=UPI002F3F6902
MEISARRDSPGVQAYGYGLGQKFGAEDAPVIVTRSLQRAEVAVTEIRVDRPLGRLSDPLPREDAYMICLMLREIPRNAYWEDGRQVSAFSLRAGDVTLHDLRREPLALMDKPIHSLLWYLPRSALNAFADEANVPRIAELRYDPGVGVCDDTIKHLGFSMLPALRAPDEVSRLFADHLTLAFAAHAAQTYGGMRIVPRPLKGGLAPWQERRSKEMIGGNLRGATPLREIADACGLSVSHFARAFRRSTGLAPHAWLLQARVEAAKAMLRRQDPSLPAIAASCGFADQSHFTRVFTRQVGLSPGAWRRLALN